MEIAALGTVYLQNSPKFPTCLTIIVDPHGAVTPEPSDHSEEWRLPSADPRDGGKFLYRLHTVDIYFWTIDDASSFLNTANRLLSPTQLAGTGPPQPLPQAPRGEEATISPVVKQLENVAITDPAYSHGQTRNSRSELSSQPPPPPGPPPPATSVAMSPQHTGQAPNSSVATTSGTEPSPASYAPLAYNPSAPPAPEPIKHREKTPPPPDAADGTGLATANAMDQNQAFAPPPTQVPASFAPPPVNQAQVHGSTPPVGSHVGYGAPNPAAGLARAQRTSISSLSSTPQHSNAPSFVPPPPAVPTPPVAGTSASRSGSMSFAPPPQDPNAHIYAQQGLQSPGLPGSQPTGVQSPGHSPYGSTYNPAAHHQQPQQHHYQPQYPDYMQAAQQQQQAQPPVGGYANYSYDPQQTHHSVGDPSIHSQVYRPTETEAVPQGHKAAHRVGSGYSDKAGRVEKGVNRFLKKLDKF